MPSSSFCDISLKRWLKQAGRAAASLEELGEIVVPEQGVDLSGEMAAPFRLEARMRLKGLRRLLERACSCA